MAACLAAFEPYPASKGYGGFSNSWQAAGSDAAFHQQSGVVKPYPTGIWVPESLACDYLPPGVTRVLSVTDRCPYSMRLRSEWAVRDFVFVKEIGTGNASTVWYAFCKKTSAPLAIKTYKKRKLSPLNRCQVAREINIHSQLDHPNVIALYAAFEDNDKVYLLQEYAEGGDLFDEMKRTMGRMPENQLVTAVLLPMMSALLAMHSAGFIHRDIKPENTLFAAGRVLKLADFGLAVNHMIERPVTRLGTLDYMAPEVLVCPDKHLPADNKGRSDLWYSPAVDAWALGVLAYELAVGRPPFGMSTRDETIRAIRQCPPSFPDFMSPGLVDYISHALVKPADQRSSLADLMQHPWIMEHARRAGMDAQVLAYLRVHQPAERQLLAAGTAAAAAATTVPQPGVTAAPSAQQQQHVIRMQHNPAAAAAPPEVSTAVAANSKAVVTADVTVVTSPIVSAALPFGSAAAAVNNPAAAAASPAAAAAAACYLAGLVAPEPHMLSVLNPPPSDLAAAAAAVSGGLPRIKKTAKRTGMPRCFSSKNVAGLSSLASMGSVHPPGLPHGHGHIHWHANGEALALHVPGLLLDMGGSDSPRSNSPNSNSPTLAAAAAALTGRGGMARAASMISPLHLQQQQQVQDGYNPLLGGLGGLLPGLASMHAAAAGLQQQQQGSLLPGSPTRRGLTAARLNSGSTGSGSSNKQSSSKRCTPEPDTDLAAALLTLGNNSPNSVISSSGVDVLSPQVLQQQQLLMQQYLRQQQQMQAGSAAAAAAYCQVHGCFVSPNASPKPMSRLGASGLSSSSSSTGMAAAGGGAGVATGVHALLGQQQQQQQQGQFGMSGNCTCGAGGYDSYGAAAGSGAGSSSGRSSGTKYSPCSPVLKVVTQHSQFESPLKRVNSQGTLTGSSSSMAAPQLAPQLSLPLIQQQQQQQPAAASMLMAADVDRMQQAAAAAAMRRSSTTPSPTAAAAAASQQGGRPTGSNSVEGSQPLATHSSSSAGLHMQELADVLSSPGSVANLLHEQQQQQQREIAAQQYLDQQQQQQQQLINRGINALRRPVIRACSAPSLLHPALQLQLLQYQQQQQGQQQVMGWHDGVAGASTTNPGPSSSMAAAADLYTSEQLQFAAQQQQQFMATSPFAFGGGLTGMDCTMPTSPSAAAAAGMARVHSISNSLAEQQQQQFCRSLSSASTLNHHGQFSSQLNGNLNSQSNSQLPPIGNSLVSAALYRASSPGLALLQQQRLAHTAAGWDAGTAAAAAAAAAVHGLGSLQSSAAAAYGAVTAAAAANLDVSPLQQSAAAAAGLDMPSNSSRGLSRSHSLLSELGPLQTVPESSAATYEQIPSVQQQQQQQCTSSWQQGQQQLQELAGALLLQQQQQQHVQALQQQQALQQLQMCASSAALGTAAADVYQLAAVACSQGANALNPAGSSSPFNPRLLMRHAPSRLAQVSAPLTQQQTAAAAEDL